VARERLVDLVEREGAAGVAREMLPKLIGATLQASQPDLIEAVRELIVANPTDAIRTAIRAIKDRPDSTPLLPRIDRPVTVIHGDEDAIIPLDEARAMADAIPGARLVALAGTGHLANLEDPLGFSLAVQKSL
jgi:3-oxoadipate enol-lactonase